MDRHYLDLEIFTQTFENKTTVGLMIRVRVRDGVRDGVRVRVSVSVRP